MIVAILQARMGSSRLPGKSMALINDKPLIWHVVQQLKRAKKVDRIVVATTIAESDSAIVDLAKSMGVDYFRGSIEDVLDRYYHTAKKFNADIVVRVTGDCPLLDPEVVDKVVTKFLEGSWEDGKTNGKYAYDYVSNVLPPTYPDGLDTEVFSFKALETAWSEAKLQSEREHVTPFINKNSQRFRIANCVNHYDHDDPGADLSKLRWTVDEPEDLELIKKIYSLLGDKAASHNFNMADVLNIIRKHPELDKHNAHIERNEGYSKSLKGDKMVNKGQDLWKRAKQILPGGSQLLSKRSEMYLPEQWPSYYSKAKGINVWDLDGARYRDMSNMGIGTCILGYADPDVNKAVINAVKSASMTTLNCPEEVELAEKLLKLTPWAQMVRYARTGGEATSVAVRIARASVKKDKIAFCGYHGWHDWYLSANLAGDKNLDGHLLPGLHPLGVPRSLTGVSIPFEYNRADQLEQIMEKNPDVGVIMVEPMRHHYPEKDFLKKVRELADKYGAVLIFDEITSGWRMNVGGVHSILGVNPDIVVYGKAMSNGYPMAAIVGTAEVMDSAQDSFISSTYWTERIGPAASLATIQKMEQQNVPDHLKSIGTKIGKGWEQLGKEHDLKLGVMFDFSPLIAFSLDYGDDSQAISTLFTQDLLERRYLASKAVYVSYAHKEDDVNRYLETVDSVFRKLKKAIDKDNVKDMLKGPVAHSGFKRLTS
ncbi:MAG: aminotransferase class III-fold pyridoxal phosphate-dependent enzyme [Candidatus Micrarchaeota archaeon]